MPVSGHSIDNEVTYEEDQCVNYKQKYRNLKRKFKYLIYENESFQEELQRAQRKLLKVNQDKSFLLDRLLEYEKLDDTSSDSDATISSDSELDNVTLKKKKTTSHLGNPMLHASSSRATSITDMTSSTSAPKRKKPSSSSSSSKATKTGTVNPKARPSLPKEISLSLGDGHMTSEEIERHLESRKILLDLLPERAPPTVPTEMFSNDPSSLESEPNMDTSPSVLGEAFGEEDSLIIDLDQQGTRI